MFNMLQEVRFIYTDPNRYKEEMPEESKLGILSRLAGAKYSIRVVPDLWVLSWPDR